MPPAQITLYANPVAGGRVQADARTIGLELDTDRDDGAISAIEWLTTFGPGLTTGGSQIALFDPAPEGARMDGMLYSLTPLRPGDDVSDLLRIAQGRDHRPRIDDQNICFLAGTLIATPSGEARVETLRAGDLVITRDHGPLPLVWTGTNHMTSADFDHAPNNRPVRIGAGSLGQGLPRRAVDVSPQHRVLVQDDKGDEVLISARHLMMAGQAGVTLRPSSDGYNLFHIAFSDHQIVYAEGAPMESFFTAPMAVRALPLPRRLGLIAAFPRIGHGENPMTPARPLIRHQDYAAMRAKATG